MLQYHAEACRPSCCLATVEKERYKNLRDRLHPERRIVNVADPGLQHHRDRRFCRAPLLLAPRHNSCRRILEGTIESDSTSQFR